VIALVGGQTSIGFYSVSAVKAHVRAGRLRALGVTGAARSPGEPDIPTIAESGVPGYEAVTWGGVLMPAGTPRAIINRIHAELVRALKQPDVLERLAAMDFEPVGDTPEQFARTIQTEIVKWGKVVRASGARVD
jgi:tripartite-type tricarboxylate transporter receptor subunit TctC